MSTKKSMKKQSWANKQNIIILIIVALLVIATVAGMSASRKDYEAFASCISEKGFILAGTEWCSHCKTQKALFKGAFEDVIVPAEAYKDCDLQRVWCEEAGVTGYPTWVTPDGHLLPGVQKLSTLSDVSGCALK